jgi:hypothetical protein
VEGIEVAMGMGFGMVQKTTIHIAHVASDDGPYNADSAGDTTRDTSQ